MSKLAVVVDGSSFIYRAYYALPQLTSNGRSVGAIFGFCSMLISMLDKHKSDLFVVALDSGRQTFRLDLYPEYKANRSETPEELKSQLPMVKEACAAFGVPTQEVVGFEADDIIATYAEKLSQEGYEVRILSSDKDLMQLVNDNVSLFDPIKSKTIREDDVIAKYGVAPKQMVMLQALMGDTSDNVPGVSGIGPKTAATLLNTYGSIDGIYSNLANIKQKKVREKLEAEKDLLDISVQLVRLRTDVNVDMNPDHLQITFEHDTAISFLNKYTLTSLVQRLNKRANIQAAKKRTVTLIKTINDLHNFFELNRIERFSIFATSIQHEQLIIAMACDTSVGYCVVSLQNDADLFTNAEGMTLQDVTDAMRAYLANENIHKISVHNSLQYFSDVQVVNYDDLEVMNYVLNGYEKGDKVGSLFPDNDNAVCALQFKNVVECGHICDIAELTYDRYKVVKQALAECNLWSIYADIDLALIPILHKMERNGILINPTKLQELYESFSRRIKNLEDQIFASVGFEFNVGSVKQLSDVLFNKLNLPSAESHKSLDVENLEALSEYSDVPKLIIEWRKLSKLVSTYTLSLNKLINPRTHRLHTTYNITSTATGRLSSSNPNLQNIPVRTPDGKQIKSAFISAPNHSLLSLDYSQIELRVLAHVANIQLWIDSFHECKDIHAITAANIFNVSIENVTDVMRSHAKTINFGILYGMSSFGLAKILKVSRDQANSYIQNYFAQIPEFKSFKENTLEFARKHGYVCTMFGRRCYIKDILSKNYQLRQFSERQAINAVIQGTASDIVKVAMINLDKTIDDCHAKMLLHIHDELVFEVEDEYIDVAQDQIKKLMENVVTLKVPLEVQVNIAKHLG